MENIDKKTVAGFGEEWSRFDQSALSDEQRALYFEQYFRVFPWQRLPKKAVGFDLGCGSGRWAQMVAPRVHRLHCIDPSPQALAVAKKNLKSASNCEFHDASVDALPMKDASMDFGYSLGVLHHTPDTAEGVKSAVKKLKRGAPFLLYLYYRFDNRPRWFQNLWKATEMGRKLISSMPNEKRHLVTDAIAASVYFPLAKASALLHRAGLNTELIPLSAYRVASFYTMRTDALDRFGTRLEQRFTRAEIQRMMEQAGLQNIQFSESPPYWCAVGFRK
jgi:ubiquinone/menaquinone biosynthesis C-methylase UbiE